MMKKWMLLPPRHLPEVEEKGNLKKWMIKMPKRLLHRKSQNGLRKEGNYNIMILIDTCILVYVVQRVILYQKKLHWILVY